MDGDDRQQPEHDAYGWPLTEPSSPSFAADIKVVRSILPAIRLADLQLTPLATGQEHFVYTSPMPNLADKAVKVTRPGGYGLIMEAKEGERIIGWRRATIREYLQRVHRQNRVLADSVEILGITWQRNDRGAAVPGIVTAQKFRAGTPPSREEISAYMRALGFDHVPSRMISLKYLSDFSFYSAVHNLLVSDCRSANFVKAEAGLAVIDVIVQRPTGHLRHLIRQCLGLRMDRDLFRKQLNEIIEALPAGRARSIRVAKLVDDVGGPTDTLTKLRISAVLYARGDPNHELDARISEHAKAALRAES